MCLCVCERVPELQSQSWRQQHVSNSTNLCRVSPNQLNYRHMPQVQSTLSVLFKKENAQRGRQIYNFCCFIALLVIPLQAEEAELSLHHETLVPHGGGGGGVAGIWTHLILPYNNIFCFHIRMLCSHNHAGSMVSYELKCDGSKTPDV